MKFICICIGVVSCLGFTSARAAEAATDNVLDKTFTVYGGAQIYQARGQFKATREGRPEISVNMDDLGLNENKATPVGGLNLRMAERWNLRFDYYGYHDHGNETADFSFDFEDVNIPVGAHVDSSLDLDAYVVNLAYDLIHTERVRLGVGAGVHAAVLDLKISGKITVAGNEMSLGQGEENFLAPLPNLYLSGAYGFSDSLILRFGGGWMSMKVGDFGGSLYFANAFLEYWPFQYAGIGAGYRYLKVDVDYKPGNIDQTYNVKLPGPLIYVTVGF
jgi:hypothetical protein